MSRNSNPDPARPEREHSDPGSPTAEELRALALSLLARREYGARELAAKLQRKWSAAPGIGARVNECISLLAEEGTLSEERFAEAFVRARRRRGQGPAKIRAELEQRRVDKAVVAQHLDDLQSGWLRDAVEWLERQKALAADRSDRARWYRRLVARGYGHDLALAALDSLNRQRSADREADG